MTVLTKASMILISGPSRLLRDDHHQLAGDAVTTYPLTHSQEGIWIDYLADRTSTQYNLTLGWNIASRIESQIGLPEIISGRIPIPLPLEQVKLKLVVAMQPYMS
jgi:hypothetical protein